MNGDGTFQGWTLVEHPDAPDAHRWHAHRNDWEHGFTAPTKADLCDLIEEAMEEAERRYVEGIEFETPLWWYAAITALSAFVLGGILWGLFGPGGWL